jgi:hypothetical protein
LSESDAKIISIVSEKMADEHKASEDTIDSNDGLSMKDSKEILKMVDSFGPVINSIENNKIEDMVKHMDSDATTGQACQKVMPRSFLLSQKRWLMSIRLVKIPLIVTTGLA